ncbi:MAG: metal-sensitive transcriptional regulator [Solirubrobacterales bacterium]
MKTKETPGYIVSKEQLQTRLRRIRGQVEGIERMLEQDRYCIDVLTQVSAVQAALDKVSLGLLDDHARHCIVEAAEGEREDRAEEMMAAVGRLLRSR